SHDLRTPLTMITGYAEVIRDLPGENTPENVQIIIDEANRLAALVNDVLDISKLRAGVQDLDVEIFCLTDTIRQIMKRYTKLTEQDGYSIIFEADSEVYVQGDELKITQVIYNLVNNAIHYTGTDKRVVIRQTISEARVRIAVTDTGEGIAEDQLPYVWDRYYKIDKNHQLASVGTGLGLSIVKNILTLHGMPFGVSSTLNEGSTFWFEMGIAKECENGYTI
ncbi:MAG: HAMP domain-containing sensor histidine kinase, partial [Eubacterium sp.]